jgi:hypothetical protein
MEFYVELVGHFMTICANLSDAMNDMMPEKVELQGIGAALKSATVFDENLTAALRVGLGDWRDAITWPKDIFIDLAARSEFYVGFGFNHALTDFPAPAFDQSLDIAGLRREPPPVCLLLMRRLLLVNLARSGLKKHRLSLLK